MLCTFFQSRLIVQLKLAFSWSAFRSWLQVFDSSQTAFRLQSQPHTSGSFTVKCKGITLI